MAGALAVAGSPSLAETGDHPKTATLNAAELDEFMQGYYLSPAPESAVMQILWIDLGDTDRPESVHLLGIFFAHLLHQRPEVAAPLVDQLTQARTNDLTAQRARIVATAIANAELADGRALIMKLAQALPMDVARMDQLGLTEPFGFLEFTPRVPHGMDICWMSFFATGDTRYVLKVADFLDPNFRPAADLGGTITKVESRSTQMPTDDRIRAALLNATANWSLTANAARHPRVREALLTYAADHPGAAGDAARKIANGATNPQ